MSSQNQKLASGDLPPLGAEGSEALPRVIGGDGSFSLNRQSLWQVLTDESDELSTGELPAFIERLDESPAFRRGQVAELLGSLKQRLDSLPEDQPGDSPQELPTGDLVLIAHLLLRHLA